MNRTTTVKSENDYPAQYRRGSAAFIDGEYTVRPDVFIPRPETEYLVEKTIERLKGQRKSELIGFEVGLGSGVISTELIRACSNLRMFATEVSETSIQTALANAQENLGEQEGKLAVIKSFGQILDPFRSLDVRADFMVSNPPYLSHDDEIAADVLRFEPHAALFSANGDPLFFYKTLAQDSYRVLRVPRVFVEIPHERSTEIARLFQISGWSVEVEQDLTRRDRYLFAEKKE